MIFAEELPPEEREKLLKELERLQVPKTSYMAVKLREERRVECGLCALCGKPNKDTQHKACERCRAIHKEATTASREKKSNASKTAAPKPGKALSIAEVVRMATERHVSYGEMVRIIENEKEGIYK